MSLKTSAFLALIGMILLTVVVGVDFFRELTAFGQNAIALSTMLSWTIYLLASLAVTIFFLVFFRAQS